MGDTDAQASFAINLEDGTSGVAEAAGRSLQRLRDAIQGDQRELKALSQAMKNLQGGTSVNVAQFRQLQSQIAAKKQAIASAQGSFISLGGSFNRTAAASRSARERLAQFAAATRVLPGPLNALGGRLAAVGALAGGALSVGLIAAAAAFALVVVGAVAAGAALVRYALAQSDARRSEGLRLEGLVLLHGAQGGAARAAGQLQRSIDGVAASSALGRDKVASYAEQLYRSGLRGDDLAAALEGVAIKASVQGDAQAKAFGTAAAAAARNGRSVRALADEVKASLGGVAARQMLALDVQAAKMRESFNALFSGLKLERFVEGLSMITSLLSQNTATGRALKVIMEIALQPLIDSAANGAPVMKRFFQGMTIAALHVVIAILKVRNWFKRTFGGSDLLKDMDATSLALTAGKIALGLFAVGLAVAAVAIGSIVVGLATLAAPFVLAGVAVYALLEAGEALYGEWQRFDFATLGVAIIDGIVGGLKKGKQIVGDAVKGIGSSAIKAFRQALGITSPSKLFIEAGMTLPKGAEVGVQKQAPSLRKAIAGMVRVPRPSRAELGDLTGGAPRRPSRTDLTGGAARMRAPEAEPAREQPAGRAGLERGSTSVAVSVGEIHVHTTSDKPRDLALELKRELERLLEGVAIQVGAVVPGAT